ncbi:MAG: hypothetical protein OXE52_01950 [Chloroflexi bacterium]|nr:hypothetical protein [Chloroflexota bacterium]
MRLFMIIAVIAALTFMPAAWAQDSVLSPCSTAEIDAVHAGLDEMTAFFHRASDIRSADDLLAYSHSHIKWREGYWTNTPLCAESFEIALLANQLIGDFVALVLVNSLLDDVEVNPYRAERKNGTAKLQELLDALPPPVNTADLPLARTLQECSDAEYEFLTYTLLPDYGELADIANAVETEEGFLGYVEAQLAWRQDSLTRYPPCVDALEFGWLASQTAGDIAAQFAYYFVGASEDAIPYSEPERHGSRRLGEIAEDLRAKALPDEVIEALERELGSPGGGNWRRCSVDELETIRKLLPGYQMLEDMAAGIETLEDLLAYSHAQIEWRENLLSELARCGEVLEIAWLIGENIGDLAIMYSLKFLDVAPDESPVWQQVMSNVPGINTWEQLLPSLLSTYEQIQGDTILPACNKAELDALADILIAHLSIFKERAPMRSTDDLTLLVADQLSWREFGFSQLPLCYGSLEIFLRAYWFASDNGVGVALALAGVPDADNPYPEQQSIGKSHIERWYAIVDGIAPAPGADTASKAREDTGK